MSPPRKAFTWIFGGGLILGLAIGLVELVAPNAASVSLNDQDVTGVAGLVVATCIGAFAGLILGLIAAGIVKLATRGSRRAA